MNKKGTRVRGTLRYLFFEVVGEPGKQCYSGDKPLRFTAKLKYGKRKPRVSGASRQAADGIRTHDLLHGKQTL